MCRTIAFVQRRQCLCGAVNKRLTIGKPRVLGRDVLPLRWPKFQTVEFRCLPFEFFTSRCNDIRILFAQGELAFDFAPSFPGAGELLP